jgi:hypothetical protein
LKNQGKSTIIVPVKTENIQYKPSNFDGIFDGIIIIERSDTVKC